MPWDLTVWSVVKVWPRWFTWMTVRIMRITTHTWQEFYPGHRAIRYPLMLPSTELHSPKQCSPTHLLRVPRGALVPPAPWVMLEFLLAVMVISALCKHRALWRRQDQSAKFPWVAQSTSNIPRWPPELPEGFLWWERKPLSHIYLISSVTACGPQGFPDLGWGKVCELTNNFSLHRKWFLKLHSHPVSSHYWS